MAETLIPSVAAHTHEIHEHHHDYRHAAHADDNVRSSGVLHTDFYAPSLATMNGHRGSLQTTESSHGALSIEQHLLTPEDKTKPRLVGAGEWALAFGNAGVSIPELAVAIVRKAGVAAMDSLHNWFDFLGYLKQLRLIVMASPESQEVFDTDSRFKMWGSIKKWLAQSNTSDEARLEKSSFALISLPAIGAAALAGAGLASEIVGSSDHDGIGWADAAHLGAAGAALVLAGGLMRAGSRMVGKVGRTDRANPNLVRHVNNFYAHAKLDAASSGAAVAESLIHLAGSGVWAVNLGVLAISGYQIWRFWPSRAGRQDFPARAHEHEHDHHDECSHGHLVSHEAMDVAAAGWRRLKTIGRVAVHGTAAPRDTAKSVTERQRSWLARMKYKPMHSRSVW